MFYRNVADYWSILEGTVTTDLYVADFLEAGQKEAFAGVGQNPTNHDVQNEMIRRLRSQGFVGWISRLDRTEGRLELCIFPEYISSSLTITGCYAYGP